MASNEVNLGSILNDKMRIVRYVKPIQLINHKLEEFKASDKLMPEQVYYLKINNDTYDGYAELVFKGFYENRKLLLFTCNLRTTQSKPVTISEEKFKECILSKKVFKQSSEVMVAPNPHRVPVHHLLKKVQNLGLPGTKPSIPNTIPRNPQGGRSKRRKHSRKHSTRRNRLK